MSNNENSNLFETLPLSVRNEMLDILAEIIAHDIMIKLEKDKENKTNA